MKNVERKELIELLDGFTKKDCKEDLLQLIKNGIVDERMCQSRHSEVHEELAKNGYFVDVFIKDEEEYVRYCAYEWLVNNNKLEQKYIDLAIQQDDEDFLLLLIKDGIVDERMCQNKDIFVRKELAKNGYFIDVLIKDKYENIRYQAYKWLIQNNKLEQQHIDLAIQQDDGDVLLLFIKNKIVDEKMCQSEWCDVREELAMNGYFIDYLINDRDYQVKYYVYEWLIQNNKIKQNHIDLAIQKDEPMAQISLIENGIINKRMCQSQWFHVRVKLAKNGYFIDVLIDDQIYVVRFLSYKWLIKNNKLKQKHINQLFFNKDYEVLQLLVNSNYKNKLINKEQFLKKIKEFQEEKENNLSLLIHNKNILK